jgi:hypothetical protein
MPLFNFIKNPKEGNNTSNPSANKRPAFEPKRVIHPPKIVSNTGISDGRSASTIQSIPKIPPEINSQSTNINIERFPVQTGGIEPVNEDRSANPGMRLRSLVNADKIIPVNKSQEKAPGSSRGERIHRNFWDISAATSLIINIILVMLLLILTNRINQLKSTVSDLLSDLYGNFGAMDKASISTTVTVETQIPINFMLPIQQNTNAILTDSISIPNAHVIINSGGLSINASANITLPAGTNLPIGLNLAVPVQASVPITLQVPINIPLAQTGLHQPLTSLQDSILTYNCTFDKNAQNPQGSTICEDADIPSTTPGVP